ncbi:hypothetical protein ABW19_dt0204116 [Dactylella cylindrospora]|nr:hypothetical protein ABW19_dt0204116 [Dactylella cylindrospora]
MRYNSPSVVVSLVSTFLTFVTESSALGTATVINVSPTLLNSAAAPTVDRGLISYSVELMAIVGFTQSSIANNLFDVWTSKTGGRPGLRIGGSGMDRSSYVPGQQDATVYRYENTGSQWYYGPSYFPIIANYFPQDMEITFGLNLANTTNNWKNTIDFAVAAKNGIPQINLFEIGNEIDNFVQNGLREEPWRTSEYASQWSKIANMVKAQIPDAEFQPAVYASSFRNDFNLGALVRAGVNNNNFRVPTYSMHFYPQSYCDAGRPSTRVDNLVDHNLLTGQLERFQPEIDAAEGGGGRFTWAETNSVSCSGAPGISDTFASALWLVDWSLASASKNVHRIYVHNTLTTPYSMFLPKPGNVYPTGVRPLAYGMYFLAETLALPEAGSDTKFLVTPVSLPGNPSDISVYGLYSNSAQEPEAQAASGNVKVVTSTVRVTGTTVLSAGRVSTVKSVSSTRVPVSVVTAVRTLTSRTVVTVQKTTNVPKATTVLDTTTFLRSSLGGGVMTITTVVYIYGKPTTVMVPSVVQATTTSTVTYTTRAASTVYETQATTIEKVTTVVNPVTTRVVSSKVTTYTTTVSASGANAAASDFPTEAGIYLARAVVLNLARWNTSDESALNCRSCSEPSPSGFGSPGSRPKTSVTLSGFQPNHKLKVLKLQAPGLNAKSKVSVSGMAFSDDTGAVVTEPTSETVTVDGSGNVKFDINATEGVLLVDETVK